MIYILDVFYLYIKNKFFFNLLGSNLGKYNLIILF